MFRSLRSFLGIVALNALSFGLLNPSDLPAAFIISQSSHLDTIAGIVSFNIEFNTAPDFYTLDAGGRAADSFQYYVFYNGGPHQDDVDTDVLIRGDEIRFSSMADPQIVVRDAFPLGDPDPHSGGWGPYRGSVDFVATGPTTFEFDIPVAMLGVTDDNYAYRLVSVNYGSFVGQAFVGGPHYIPEPSTFALLGLGGIGLAFGAYRKRRLAA